MHDKKASSNELLEGMKKNLSVPEKKQEALNNLDLAVDDLNSAASILDELNLSKHADALLKVLVKIAANSKDDEEQFNSLLQEDEMFGLSDDNINDLLLADTDDPDYLNNNLLKEEFEDIDFEDE